MDRRKLIALIVGAALVGGVLGSISSAEFARANLLEDVWNFLKGGVPPAAAPVAPGAEPASPYQPALDYEEAVIKAVEAASPSVVSIVISKDVPVIERCPYDPFGNIPPEFRQFFGQGFEFYQPCERGTRREQIGGGSGFIVSEDGLIVTNKHVVTDAKAAYTVFTNDGKKYDARVVARDPLQDLAVIRINASGLTPARLGNSDSVKLGQTAIAIGNALGEFRNTVSVGVVSGLARTITASGEGFGTETIQGVIQTDAAVNPGNSGGPLLNLRGEVIGIATAIASGAENVGFAIPVNQAKRAIESVKRTGKIVIPYLGIRYLMVDEEVAKRDKLPVAYGALIRGTSVGPGVIPNSPAAEAGLKTEDIILEMNGVKLDDTNPLGTVIQRFNVGDAVTLTARRGDQTLTFQVVLAERPAEQ